MRYVALLRGVNVGGKSRVAMADLKQLLASLGLEDVATYVQSGNAVFRVHGQAPSNLSGEIERRIETDLGVRTRVAIRDRDELRQVVDGNPFPEAVGTPKLLHAGFLSETPEAERLKEVNSLSFEPDRFHLGDRVVYLSLPNGVYGTKIGNDFWERRLGVASTMRNWNTVTKLLDLASKPD